MSALLFLLLSLPGAGPTQGRDAEEQKRTEAKKPKRVVFFATKAHRKSSQSLSTAVRAQLSDLPVELVVVWQQRLWTSFKNQVQAARQKAASLSAGGREVIALFWCRHSPRPRLVLYARKQDRVLKRSLAGAQKGEQSETAAIITRTAVSTILKGKPPPAARPAPPPSRLPASRPRPDSRPRRTPPKARAAARSRPAEKSPRAEKSPPAEKGPRAEKSPPAGGDEKEPAATTAKSATPPDRAHHWLRLEAGYAPGGFSTEVGVTHGMLASAAVRLHQSWLLSVDYRFVQNVSGDALGASTEVSRYPIGIGGHYRLGYGRVELGGTVRLTAELLRPRTNTTSPAVEVSDDSLSAVFSVEPALYCSFRAYWRLRLFLYAGVSIPLNNRKFVVESATGEEETAVSGWPAQPRLAAGVSVDLF
jgi:hypothetical protein